MHSEAASPVLLDLLHTLMQMAPVSPFALGGGTSLALEYGHRKSIDIDLFTGDVFDSGRIQSLVFEAFEGAQIVNRTEGSLCAVVRRVKVDFLLHHYPRLKPDRSIENVRFCSLEDLSAMKVNAVVGRGSKKDFSDLLLLHEQGLVLQQSVENFCAKYGPAGRFLAIRSLNWFEDAEDEPDPLYLNGWTWPQVRREMELLARELGS